MSISTWSQRYLFLPAICLFFMLSAASANTFVTGGDVKQAIQERLAEEDIVAVPKVVDHRLYYRCDRDLMVDAKYPGSWDTVTVTCPNQNPTLQWSVMIRVVDASPDLKDNSPPRNDSGPKIVSLLASVRKGEVLTSDIIALMPAPRGSRLGFFYRIEDVIGRRTAQALSAMKPLRARNLEFDWAITAGQPVQIVKRISGLEIATFGEALDDGQIGDIITVRNVKSKKIISVLVENSKKVTPLANID